MAWDADTVQVMAWVSFTRRNRASPAKPRFTGPLCLVERGSA
jgi:hypothetical protein